SGNAGAKRKHCGTDALASNQGAPGTDVQAEERANDDPVVRPNSRRPHDARMRISNAIPIVTSNSEHDGTACRSARAMNTRNFFSLNSMQVPKGRTCCLGDPHIRFVNTWEQREIIQSL